MLRLTYLLPLVALVMLSGCADDEGMVGGSGLIEADDVIVSAETPGRTMRLYFDEGTVLARGDTLALIDTTRLSLRLQALAAAVKATQASLATARVAVEQAGAKMSYLQTEFDRVKRLLASGTATQRQFDQVENEFTQAQLAHRSAKTKVATIEAEITRMKAEIATVQRELEDCHPLSPINGVVTDQFVEAGELLATGKPILQVAQLDTVWVKIYLPAGDFANVKLGSTAAVDTEAGERNYNGTVVWTADESEFTPKNVQTKESRANLVYAVKVRIPNDDGRLKIGMPVYVTLDMQS